MLVIPILMARRNAIMLAAAGVRHDPTPIPHHPCRGGFRPAKTRRHVRRERQHHRNQHESRSNDGQTLGPQCITSSVAGASSPSPLFYAPIEQMLRWTLIFR
jgi:hypothetical protein